jgi:Kef-type K+ transport system membrane component KefB
MVSREEVGIIVAGVGVYFKILTSDVYTAIIIMVALTTVVTPIWLKRAYQRERIEEPG